MAAFLPTFAYGVIVVLLLWYVAFRRSRRRLYELADKIEGLPTLPLIGNAHQFAGTTMDILSNITRIIDHCCTHDGISKVWLGPKLYIAINDPDASEIILNTEMSKAWVYKFWNDWLGNGLVNSAVPIWKRHRKMLSPTFSQKVLDGFVSIFAEQSGILVDRLTKMVGKGTFNIHDFISACTLDTICESAMGTKIESQRSTLNESYIHAAVREMRLIYQRMFQIWLQPSWLFSMSQYKKQHDKDINTLHNFSNAIVKRKMMEFKKKKVALENGTEYMDTNERKAFLDSMIEYSDNNNCWTAEELREEVDTITMTGYDTTAHASCFVLSTLAMLPDVQEKVMDELREIYGDSKRAVIKEDLSKMFYLERVIKETLRIFPIVPIVVRELTEEIKLSKHTLPAGADCVVTIIGIHKDKKIWGDDANEFNPDRFLPENAAKRNPNTYIPFSAGPRNCIGKNYAIMSVKSLVSSVLRSYKLHSDLNYKDIPLMAEVIMKPVNGHLMSIERRTSS